MTVVLNAVRVLVPKAVFSVGTCISLGLEKARIGDVVISLRLTTTEGFKTPASARLGSLAQDAPYGWEAPLKHPDEREIEVHCNGDILSQSLTEKCQYDDICEQYPEAIAIETEGKVITENRIRLIPSFPGDLMVRHNNREHKSVIQSFLTHVVRQQDSSEKHDDCSDQNVNELVDLL